LGLPTISMPSPNRYEIKRVSETFNVVFLQLQPGRCPNIWLVRRRQRLKFALLGCTLVIFDFRFVQELVAEGFDKQKIKGVESLTLIIKPSHRFSMASFTNSSMLDFPSSLSQLLTKSKCARNGSVSGFLGEKRVRKSPRRSRKVFSKRDCHWI